MKLFNALRGGSNKDAMRQTTSLTMAYLLEQNARFEVFMRQKVNELEAIVAQQQARHVEAGPVPVEEPERQSVERAGADGPVQVPAGVDMTGLAETRPVKPVASYFSDFTIDDLAPGPKEELFAGDEPLPVEEPVEDPEIPGEIQAPVGLPSPGPVEPPDWQALLLGRNPAAEATSDRAGAKTGETTTGNVVKEMEDQAETLTLEEDEESATTVIAAGAVDEKGTWQVALDKQGPAGHWE